MHLHPRHPARYPRLLATHTLPARPASAATARATIRTALPAHLRPEIVDTVELLTCELVTNAIVHAATPCRLRLSQPEARVLRVEVDDDTGPAASVGALRPTPADDTGRGLLLVDALAADWGEHAHPGGKTVWFDVHV